MDGEYILSNIEYFKDKDISGCCDELTGVLSRDGIKKYVCHLIEEGIKFSFFLIDVDNFKNVNDTYGHIVGDAVLAQTATSFINICGESAAIGRFGGDEFIVIFENVAEYQDVWNLGNKLNHLRISGLNDYGIPHLSITLSVGISRFPLDAQSYENLLGIADKAMYIAKTKGRHCFIIYQPEQHANISLQGERDKKQKITQISTGIFNSLTACGENISSAVSTVFKSLVGYYMFDHICLETHKKFNHSVVFTLSEKKRFKHIPYEMIDALVSSAGYVYLNDINELNARSYSAVIKECKKQDINSVLYCRIAAYGIDYGFIRVDTCKNTRIWQNEEISTVIVAARAIALLLYYQHKTLEDLPQVPPIEAGSLR